MLQLNAFLFSFHLAGTQFTISTFTAKRRKTLKRTLKVIMKDSELGVWTDQLFMYDNDQRICLIYSIMHYKAKY